MSLKKYLMTQQEKDKMLLDAAKKKDVEQLKRALVLGANKDTQEGDGYTALMHAAINGDEESMQVLLGAKADPYLGKYKGLSVLNFASAGGHVKCLEMLLTQAAEPYSDADLFSAMEVAVTADCPECLVALVNAGGDVHTGETTKDAHSLMDIAFTNRSVACLPILCSYDVKVNNNNHVYRLVESAMERMKPYIDAAEKDRLSRLKIYAATVKALGVQPEMEMVGRCLVGQRVVGYKGRCRG